MRIRSLAPKGIERFRELLEDLRVAEDRKARWDAIQPELSDLRGGGLARPGPCDAEIDPGRRFGSRHEMGRYLVEALGNCDQAALETDAGVWAWLALLWLEQFVFDEHGRPLGKIPDDENFIPPETMGGGGTGGVWRTWHRHAVRTTYFLVREHGENAELLLCNPMHKRGELTEQLTGRADLLPCRPVVEAMVLLYRDPRTGRPKRGAAGKGPGSSRRFAYVMRQLMVNYDLYSMKAEDIIALLPAEFDHFRGVERPRPSLLSRLSSLLSRS